MAVSNTETNNKLYLKKLDTGRENLYIFIQNSCGVLHPVLKIFFDTSDYLYFDYNFMEVCLNFFAVYNVPIIIYSYLIMYN